jgi:glycine cleavage system H protein
MSTLKFTTAHEWLRSEDDGSISLGISDYAQEQLGDIVYVELPVVGAELESGANLAVIESVKAVGEINMPFAGTVRSVNGRLADEPEIVNADPFGEGWLLRIAADDAGALNDLMDEATYQTYLEGL